jgi:hypothetical protein
MKTRRLGLLASLIIAGLIAGCAQGTGTPTAGGSSSVPSSSTSSASDSPTSPAPPASPAPGTSSQPAGPDLTISGLIETGVEANCLILRSNGGTYQLMGGDKNVVKSGNNVVVTGHVVKGVMSYCMQGQPFEITQARLA